MHGGFVCVNKPPGMSSHDVVSWARRLFGIKKIGHTGTLDPGAAGVLVLALGAATKVLEFMEEESKAYRVECTLGISTDTQDKSGRAISVTPCLVTWQQVEETLNSFVGTINQVPPMVSALKYKGQRLYELARRGEEIERPPRQVQVFQLRPTPVRPGLWMEYLDLAQLMEELAEENRITPVPDGSGARVMLDVVCSRGTYIRTLCHDLGQALGCGAYMSFLLRTASGPFVLKQALTLEQWQVLVEERGRGLDLLGQYVLPISYGLSHLPFVRVDASGRRRLIHGSQIRMKRSQLNADKNDKVLIQDETGQELCIAVIRPQRDGDVVLQPVKVLRS